MVRAPTLILLTMVGACAPRPDTEPFDRAPLPPRPTLTAGTWAALAADPTVAAVADDVALICDRPVLAGDAAPPRCDAAVVAADGARAALGHTDLLAAARLDGHRLVLATAAGELRVRAGADEQLLAVDARDPRVASDRRVIAYTQYPPGRGPGDGVGRLVAIDLDRGARWVITDDPLASSPFPIPGGAQTLYVSARSGLASWYVAAPGQPPRQLTNVGRRTVDAGFVPVAGRELAWLDARHAIYAATYDGVARLWALDVDTGAARELGPGRRPRAAAGGVEVVTDGVVRTLIAADVIAQLEVAP